MDNIYRVIRRLNANEIEASDAFDRKKKLSAATNYKVGDRILVTNGIVVGKIKKEAVKTYQV